MWLSHLHFKVESWVLLPNFSESLVEPRVRVATRAKGLVADRRLFLAFDQGEIFPTRLVEDGSPAAAFLLAPQGDMIPANEAARLGLELVDGCIVQRPVEPQIACPKCRVFVMAVQGVRGPYWEGREQTGRRRSYRVGGAHRDGSVTVERDFFDDFCRQCAWWLDHVADEEDPQAHCRELPSWIAGLPASVDFSRKVGRDAATQIAADVLGISARSMYRGGRSD
jgi:hypothetical protein